jgi:hypothetical protein
MCAGSPIRPGLPNKLVPGPSAADHRLEPHLPDMTTMTSAADARQHLLLLLEERVLAHEHGLMADPAYRADLEQELAATREAYVGAAVTEIASLRAAVSAPLLG